MRRLISSMMVSLDGFFEGADQELDWHVVDQEFNAAAAEQLDEVETILFGRVTYELMAGYWPRATDNDPVVTQRMNSMPKIVFSRTLERAEWRNTRLVNGNAVEEVRALKMQPGGDLILFGSSDLTAALIDADLVDEYRVMMNPVLLGEGKQLFIGIRRRRKLRLLRTRTFHSGNVLLCYAPVR